MSMFTINSVKIGAILMILYAIGATIWTSMETEKYRQFEARFQAEVDSEKAEFESLLNERSRIAREIQRFDYQSDPRYIEADNKVSEAMRKKPKLKTDALSPASAKSIAVTYGFILLGAYVVIVIVLSMVKRGPGVLRR